MCLCTSPYANCRPTERAKGLGRLLLYVILILFVLLILGFFGGVAFTQSFFTIGLVITGWCAVRNSRCYNIEQLMCVVFISGYLWVYAVVDSILYLVNSSHNINIPALISLFGGVIFYVVSCYVSKLLYDELRLNYEQPPADEMGGGFGMFGGGGRRGGIFGRMMGGGGGMGYGRGQQQPPQAQQGQPLGGQGQGQGQGQGRQIQGQGQQLGYGQPQQQQQGYAPQQYGQGPGPGPGQRQGQGQMPPPSYQQQSNSNYGDSNQKFQAFQGSGHSMN
jgi:hypothetical protein